MFLSWIKARKCDPVIGIMSRIPTGAVFSMGRITKATKLVASFFPDRHFLGQRNKQSKFHWNLIVLGNKL